MCAYIAYMYILYIHIHTHTSQNHGMAWVGRDLKDHQVPTPLSQAELPTPTSSTTSILGKLYFLAKVSE